ncbi:MAG: carbohydrate kinase family protein [bacterium]
MRKKVAVVGDISTDHFLIMDSRDRGVIHQGKAGDEKICFNYGEKIPVKKTLDSFGGSALNVAVSLNLQGADVELVSFLGRDFEGREAMGFLHSKQIGTDNIDLDQTTNQSYVIVFESERTVLSNHLKRNYSRLVIPRSDYIYFASAGEGSDDLINKIRAEVSKGVKLIFNPGSYEIKNFDLFKPLLQITSILILNKEEADKLFDASQIKAQLEKILASGAAVAIVTDDKNGAYFGVPNQFFRMSAPVCEVVDPTGAGDSFSAGLLSGIMSGRSLEESAKWGMINSASVIESLGANEGTLTTEEIEKSAKQNNVLKFSKI